MRFKKDLIDILINNKFDGDMLEIGTNTGNTTAILGYIGNLLSKNVYSFEMSPKLIEQANVLLSSLKIKVNIIQKDVYREQWDLNNIGFVFIDCVHKEECFEKDIDSSVLVCNRNPIIIAHDYGLVNGGIKSFLSKNKYKYDIIRFVGEKEGWNEMGTSETNDWEGVQIKIL